MFMIKMKSKQIMSKAKIKSVMCKGEFDLLLLSSLVFSSCSENIHTMPRIHKNLEGGGPCAFKQDEIEPNIIKHSTNYRKHSTSVLKTTPKALPRFQVPKMQLFYLFMKKNRVFEISHRSIF